MAEGAAGWLLTIGSLLGIVMRIFQGARVDRGERGPLQVVIAMLLVGAVAFVGYATMVPAAMVLATPIAFGFGWAWPGLFNFSVVRNNPSAPASATGITQTGTYVGAMAGPLAFGAIAQHASYEWAWLVGAGWFLASAAFMIAGRRMMLRVKADRGLAPHETLGPSPGSGL
jgi:MFS family permease